MIFLLFYLIYIDFMVRGKGSNVKVTIPKPLNFYHEPHELVLCYQATIEVREVVVVRGKLLVKSILT
jgi:hypothetical protein